MFYRLYNHHVLGFLLVALRCQVWSDHTDGAYSCVRCVFPGPVDEENLLQLSAATINAEWLVGAVLCQSCQGQSASGFCSACQASATECTEPKPPAEGSNEHTPKVELSC